MSQNFVQQIDNLRRRLQRRRLVAAVCWAIATLVVTALMLSAFDRLLGVIDFFGRVLFTTAFASICFFVSRHWFRSVLSRPIDAVEVARRIERREPELRDLVTSALEFSQQAGGHPLAGSESLRRAVVVQTSVELEDVDWQQFVPRQPLRRAMSAAGGVLLVVGLVGWWAPQTLGIGFARLLNPLSDLQWPRIHSLEFVSAPKTLAAGDDLVLQLHDTTGRLPDSVEVHYRIWRNRQWHEQAELLATGGNLLEVLRPNVQQSLEYRATGGDHHTMPWQKLEVVAPPQVKNLQIRVHPPQYTGLPSEPLENDGRLLVGSGLQLTGECDLELASVVLRGGSGLAIPATLDSSGKRFHISPDTWHADISDEISLELTTMTGLSTRAAWHLALEVVPDQPPKVRILEPSASLQVTPAAVVPLVVVASDDLAIQNVELLYRRSDRTEQVDQTISLLQGPERSPVPSTARQRRIKYLWQLVSLSLQPGDVLEVHARASDYQVAVGQTRFPLRLQIVSIADLLRDISEEDLRVLKALERLLQQQQDARKLVMQWDQDPVQPWPEMLRTVLSRQRRITASLADPHSGILRSIEKLAGSYARNQLDRKAAIDQLYDLHELLGDLVEEPLQRIERLLRELVRASQRPEVTGVAELQSKVIKALRQAIDSLSLENELARFESALAEIESRQRELAELSQRDISDALSQDSKSSQSTETGQQASLRQNQLSRRFAKLEMQMAQAIKKQSVNSGSLSDTMSLARDLGVQSSMRAAADSLAQQQIGKALELQRESVDHLSQLRERLAKVNVGEKKDGEVNTPRAGDKKSSPPTDSRGRPEGSGEAGTKPNDSTASTHQMSQGVSEEVATQLIKDLWGNLPQRQREQILQPLSETFLPKYAEEIQAYFRKLAQYTNADEDSRHSENGNDKSN